MNNELIENMCEWLKTTKCITKIDIEVLAYYLPQYENYLKTLKN